MPIANYDELKAAVGRWMNRPDLVDEIPNFIRSAEGQISLDLRLRQQLTITTLDTVVGFNGARLPDDFLEFDSVTFNGNELTQISFGDLVRSKYTGIPRHYAIGGNELLLSVQADSVAPIEVSYFARFLPLEEQPTNGLLVSYPDVYLFASLMMANRFTMNEEAAAKWQGQYIGLVGRLKGADERAKWSGSPLRMRTR